MYSRKFFAFTLAPREGQKHGKNFILLREKEFQPIYKHNTHEKSLKPECILSSRHNIVI